MMISVFGSSGFIGSRFCEMFPMETFKIGREQREPPTNTVLNFISTTDNYNVYDDVTKDIKTNLVILMEMLDASRKRYGNNFTFVQISSWFVYGNQPLPITEDSYCNPKGFYAITKRCSEQLLISYCDTFKIRYKILRLGNVFGPGDKGVSKKKNALQYLIGELKANQPISLYGGGEFTRDYMYVDDVCSGIKLCIDKAEPNQIIHVASGIPYKFRDLIYYCKEKLGSTSEITSMEATDFHKVVQTKDNYLDVSKITALGFKPKFTIWEGLDKVL
jgi:nucleoside-diphosphate-sugar epimerase